MAAEKTPQGTLPPDPPAPLLERLGPLTDLGREATSIRTWQDTVRRASGEPASPGGPAIVRPAGLDDATAASRRAAAATHLTLGSTLLAAGKPGQAIASFRQASLLDPENPAAHNDLGLACLRSARPAEAVAAFRRAIALKEDFSSAHYNLGLALENQRDDMAAIAAYRRAAALAPNFLKAHERLGVLLDRTSLPAEAIQSFERAAAAKPSSTLGRLSRAEALRIRGQLAEAETWFRRAVAADPANSYALRSFGIFLTNMGRFDEAADCLARALAANPTDVVAFFNLTNVRKFAAEDRPLLARMGRLIETARLGDIGAELLNFGLGKAFDDLGEYEAAMRHFDAGNELGAGSLRFDRPAFAARVDRLIARFGVDEPERPAAPSSDEPRPILIVGTPRSGTTLVEQIVSSHRDVGAGGELGFWEQRGLKWEAAIEEGAALPSAGALVSEYHEVLRAASPGAPLVTDKMPTNFFWLGLVRLAFPGATIIHCRRDPLDTCLSIYTKRFPGSFYSRDRASLVFFYRQYQRLMAHWRAVLPPERFLEVDYEALVTDREAQTRRMIAFLGLPWDEACLAPERNRRLVSTSSMWQVRQPVYASSIGRWRRYEPWLGELRELLDDMPAGAPGASP